MIIPIPFFIKSKSKEDIDMETRMSNFKYHQELKVKLNQDIDRFKQRFNNKDITQSPEAYAIYTMFGHTDIEKLNLQQLMQLGFHSDYITRQDCEKYSL